MPDIALSPEMERFAAALVAAGDYPDIGAVAEAALREMKARAKAELIASLEEASREADEHGCHEVEDVLAEILAELDAKRAARAAVAGS